jgi:hypothetical protein
MAEEREASQAARRREALVRTARVTLRDAVFAVMEEAIASTSGGGRTVFPKRNLFYSVRRLIQAHTSEGLAWKYFEGNLVKAWEAEHGPIPRMYCDPRGYFIEPHTGRQVPLGTREVEAYQIPAWRYDKIIYVEKKGFHGLFQQAQIAERYDLGIMCAEGYSSEAGKLLLARAEQAQGMTILSFHDADPFGYNIARKLRHMARAGRKINVIDAGLKLAEALDMGLEPEHFDRDRALPKGLELDDLEREYFEGEPTGEYRHGRPVYRGWRVELNDLASDPGRFIAYVEEKLKEHGCAQKLVPPRKVVLDRAAELRSELLDEAVREELSRLLDLDGSAAALVKALSKKVPVKDLPGALADWAGGLEAQAWSEALRQQVSGRVESLADTLREQALALIRRLKFDQGS